MATRIQISGVVVLVGTRKGLFMFRSDRHRRRWQREGPFLAGEEVNHATLDRRTGVVYVTANSPWFGSRIVYSPDMGKTWRDSKAGLGFSAKSGVKLERLWHIEPGRATEPSVVYCGVAPAALFRSDDGGESWQEVRGLSAHPSRERWEPGAGGLCLHSIVLDPKNGSRMWVGISSVGTLRTDDGGKSWRLLNRGVRADFLPEKYPEFGQCVHHLVPAAGDNDRLYQQNHCGVYRSDDAGENWREVTAGLPSEFGFPMAAHPHRRDVAYVVPLQAAEFRCPPEGKLRVYRTQDAGRSWEPLTRGLPQRGAYMGLYREGLSTDTLEPAGVYMGTNTGQLYVSADEGERWRRLTAALPPVFSVSAAALD